MDPLADKYAGYSPYNYVLGNPISLFDPDGREACCLLGGLVGAGVELATQVVGGMAKWTFIW